MFALLLACSAVIELLSEYKYLCFARVVFEPITNIILTADSNELLDVINLRGLQYLYTILSFSECTRCDIV